LRDPRLAQNKIGELAPGAGFAGLSHVNHSYCRHFSETPPTPRANAALKENH
jgi:transcriptional regulator GlxA family with amidase domain